MNNQKNRKLGHNKKTFLENKELIPAEQMIKKIKECVNAKRDKNFKIIARSEIGRASCRERV